MSASEKLESAIWSQVYWRFSNLIRTKRTMPLTDEVMWQLRIIKPSAQLVAQWLLIDEEIIQDELH